MNKKAFFCSCGDCLEGALLVFADDRNKAKRIASTAGLYEWEYIYVRAIRAKDFDGYYSGIEIIETNDGLPDGVLFYSEDDLG